MFRRKAEALRERVTNEIVIKNEKWSENVA